MSYIEILPTTGLYIFIAFCEPQHCFSYLYIPLVTGWMQGDGGFRSSVYYQEWKQVH